MIEEETQKKKNAYSALMEGILAKNQLRRKRKGKNLATVNFIQKINFGLCLVEFSNLDMTEIRKKNPLQPGFKSNMVT